MSTGPVNGDGSFSKIPPDTIAPNKPSEQSANEGITPALDSLESIASQPAARETKRKWAVKRDQESKEANAELWDALKRSFNAWCKDIRKKSHSDPDKKV